MRFKEGFAAFRVDSGRTLFINRNGEIVAAFQEAYSFSEGLAAVLTDESGGLWGFVDQSFKLVIESQFLHVEDFMSGVAAVQVGDQVGYINRSADFVVAPTLDYGLAHHDGYAAVSTDDNWYVIDATGKRVTAPLVKSEFFNGLAGYAGLQLEVYLIFNGRVGRFRDIPSEWWTWRVHDGSPDSMPTKPDPLGDFIPLR